MRLLDLTFPAAAHNLACDEALLDCCEAGGCDAGILRFWEPIDRFVVVGYANHVATEVNVEACKSASVPILRRCSGGGTVFQGPGCLNYSLLLKIDAAGPLNGITTANQVIMARNRDAVEEALNRSSSGEKTSPMTPLIAGHTDLMIAGLKFSGNAQRRRKNFLLFHGTFLLNLDLSQVGKFLPMPSKQPAYRQGRSHSSFLMNLPVDKALLKNALANEWGAADEPGTVPLETIETLARDKYVTDAWNLKF